MAYVIRQTRHYYGPKDINSLVDGEIPGQAMQFESRAAALEYIDQLNAARYVTSHNEYTRPDYTVLRADRLPQYLQSDL